MHVRKKASVYSPPYTYMISFQTRTRTHRLSSIRLHLAQLIPLCQDLLHIQPSCPHRPHTCHTLRRRRRCPAARLLAVLLHVCSPSCC